jgi:hypothetical protein
LVVVAIDEGVAEGLFGCGLGFTVDVVIALGVTVTIEVITTKDVSGSGGAKACRSSRKDVETDENGVVVPLRCLLTRSWRSVQQSEVSASCGVRWV